MKQLILLAGLWLWNTTAMAACLTLSDEGLSLDNSQAGAAQANWWAVLENHCERAQDAVLTVRFVDRDGQRVYDVRDQLVVERLGRVELKREVYVPAMYVSRIKSLRIRLEERERPF